MWKRRVLSRLRGRGLEFRMLLKLRIQNPNDLPLALRSNSAKLIQIASLFLAFEDGKALSDIDYRLFQGLGMPCL